MAKDKFDMLSDEERRARKNRRRPISLPNRNTKPSHSETDPEPPAPEHKKPEDPISSQPQAPRNRLPQGRRTKRLSDIQEDKNPENPPKPNQQEKSRDSIRDDQNINVAEDPEPNKTVVPPPNNGRGGWIAAGIMALIVLAGLGYWFWPEGWGEAEKPVVQDIRYGIANYGQYKVQQEVIPENENLRSVLKELGISSRIRRDMEDLAPGDFDNWRRIRDVHRIYLLKDAEKKPQFVVIEPDPLSFLTFGIGDTFYMERGEKEVEKRLTMAAGFINQDHFYDEVIKETGGKIGLIKQIEDALKWAVDFYHVEKGDRFSLVYEEAEADDGSVVVGKLMAVTFETEDETHTAYYYNRKGFEGYYDEKARPMKRSFLKSPVPFGRVSSPFGERYHPVQERTKFHFGTDFAAPEGTEIYAVADGVISKAEHKQNNGNYVKIRHDATYETQYLHMVKFGPGIRKGVRVRQGQVIGYVGSTGMATGPHVCYRFWKNGQQVDPKKEKLPSTRALKSSVAKKFYPIADSLKILLETAANQ